MAKFEMAVTADGLKLTGLAAAGTAFAFTRIELGSAGYTGDFSAVKQVIAPKVSLPAVLKSRGSGRVTIQGVLGLGDIAEAFYWREIGLWAEDPVTGKELLYAYGNAGEKADYLAGAEGAIDEKIIEVTFLTQNAEQISAAATGLFYTPAAEFSAHVSDGDLHLSDGDRILLEEGTIYPVVHQKAGSVHSFSGTPAFPGPALGRFAAAGGFEEGDTALMGEVSLPFLLPDGKVPGGGAFREGEEDLALFDIYRPGVVLFSAEHPFTESVRGKNYLLSLPEKAPFLGFCLFGKTAVTGTGEKSPDNPYVITGVPGFAAVTGKNLLPRTSFKGRVTAGITWTVNADGTVSANGTATGNGTNFIFHGSWDSVEPVLWLEAGVTYTLSSGIYAGVLYPDGGTRTVKDTFTLSKRGYIRNVYNMVSGGTVASNLTFYPQLEQGSEATAYEPFTGVVYNCPGTELHDYYGADTLDPISGVLTRCQGVVTLSGGESWAYAGVYSDSATGEEDLLFSCAYTDESGIPLGEMICDRLPVIQGDPVVEKIRYSQSDKAFYLLLHAARLGVTSSSTSAQKVSALKSYLASNSLKVLYQLERPARSSAWQANFCGCRGETRVTACGEALSQIPSGRENGRRAAEIFEIAAHRGGCTLRHRKNGTVHILEGIWGLSGLIPIRFRATGTFAAGDTFQVDGADFEACTPAGGAPGDGAFAAGAQVLALADIEGKKICLSGGDAAAASASLQTAALQAETDTAVVETDYRLLMVENEII